MAGLKPWTLRDGVVVVTGAASGIGAALAANLARRGAHLALVDLNAGGLEAVAVQARGAGVAVSTHVLDVADHAVSQRPGFQAGHAVSNSCVLRVSSK